MRCKQCQVDLVPVIKIKKGEESESDVIMMGNVRIFRASVKCPECGYVNYFRAQIRTVDVDDVPRNIDND